MSAEKRIVLFSNDQALTDDIRQCVRDQKIRFDAHSAPLETMNGRAAKIAKGGDLVICHAAMNGTEEIEALSALRAEMGEDSAIIALAREDLSLADARRLKAAGVNDVVAYPAPPEELSEQIEDWTKKPEYPVPALRCSDDRLGRVVTVTEARGGLGATTLAVNIAHRLLDTTGLIKKRTSYRVALVDLDLQFGAISNFLDVEPNDALYRLAADGSVPDSTYMEQALVKHDSGLSILTAPSTLCPPDALEYKQVAAIVDALRGEFDFVVIDLPRVLVEWMPAVIDRTDRMLLLTDTSVPCIRQARRLIDIHTEDALNLDVRVVASRESKPRIARRHHREAQQVLERTFETWLPEDAKSCRAAADRGVPISVAAGRSVLVRKIDGIARSLINDIKIRNDALGAAAQQ